MKYEFVMPRRIQRSDFVEATRKAIVQLQSQGFPAIHAAAKVIEMKPRALQRRVSKAGTSYSRVFDDLRFEAACRLLKRESQSIAEIARELDYSDPAHFTRAFVRWTGLTPRAYRHQCKGCRSVKYLMRSK